MKVPPVFIFGTLLLLIDIPFVSTFVMSKYATMGMRLSSPLYAALAYFAMTMAWFLIQGDVKKGALVGFVVFGTYAFTLSAVHPGYTKTIGLLEVLWGTTLYTLATLGTNKVMSLM